MDLQPSRHDLPSPLFAPAPERKKLGRPPRKPGQLGPRGKQLVRMAALGYTNPEIARQIGITEHTVRKYFSQIKMVSARALYVPLALRNGLVTVQELFDRLDKKT